MSDLSLRLSQAVQAGSLLASSAKNIEQLLARSSSPTYVQSVEELVSKGAWEELNDRFFKTLAFGTGGLRGRTIGKIVTPSERGTPTALGRPEFPCVGTNAMNYFNVGRATRGLVVYIQKWRSGQRVEGR